MKNVKYLGVIGLGCAALLLTGCGGESSNSNTDNGSNSGSGNGKENEKENVKVPAKHILTCSMSEDGEKMDVEIEFNDEEDEVIGAKIIFSTKIPDGASDEEIDAAEELLEQTICGNDEYKNCKVSAKGGNVVVEAEASDSTLEDEDMSGTKDDVAKEFESQGFSCK